MKQKFTLIAFVLFQSFLVAQTVKIGATTYASLSAAVTAAVSDDIITISGTITQTAQITISDGKNLTFTGQSSALIEGDNTNRLFSITGASTLTFTDITFNSISSSSQGSVLLTNNNGADITFTNCIFSSNTTTNTNGGGALFISASDVTITNCTFSSNTSTSLGGAIGLKSSAGVTITGTTFYQNSASNKGGAISLIETAQLDLTNCTFFENSLTVKNDAFEGAAIRANASGAKFTATNCLFYDNKDNDGDFADLGSVAGTGSSIVNSLAQYINTNVTNTNSTVTGSDFLVTSSLIWSSSLNKITYGAPSATTDDTPIDFGSDTEDVGAWDSKINIFKGGASGAVEAWTTATNWSNGTLPTATDNVAILTGGACTLNGEATINDIKVTGRLDIKSNRVLIVNGTSDVTGTVRYARVLTDDVADLTKAWHLVSSPLSGEVFDATYLTLNDIASGTDTGGNINMGIATYNAGQTGAAAWSYYNTGTNSNITANSGQGYSIKITPDGITNGGEFFDNNLTFEGDFNTSNTGVTTASLPTGFNLLGNPYTSFVNSATFLGANANIDQTQIWVWDSANDTYVAKPSGPGFILPPAQGFFVNVTTTGTLNFAEANQSTTGDTFQKSSRTALKFVMTDGTNSRFAQIYYLDNAKKGFDFGWEGETFGGIANSLDVFTNLIAENQGKKYQVQSLPLSEMETIIIPVGVISETGKELHFSIETANFPSDVKVYLEDRLANTFNEISNTKTFKITTDKALNDVGRFYIHTSKGALNVKENLILDNISIFKSNKTTLKLSGLPNGKSTIELFNILGKQVLNHSFETSGVKEISLPKLASGVYLIQLTTETGKLNKKIILE
jgi:hypothetical protein